MECELNDLFPLAYYSLQASSSISLLPTDSEDFSLCINTGIDSRCGVFEVYARAITVNYWNTIRTIQNNTGFRFNFEDEDRYLISYNISKYSSWSQFSMPEPIKVQLTIELCMFSSASIKEVKECIQQKEGFPLEQQSLSFEGISLEDSKNLEDYDIDVTSTQILQLKLRRKLDED